MSLTALQEERLDVLAGVRANGEKRKQAVRVADLDDLVLYAYRLKSKTVSAAPTQQQHNDLVDDVRKIHETLQSISKLLNAKLGRT